MDLKSLLLGIAGSAGTLIALKLQADGNVAGAKAVTVGEDIIGQITAHVTAHPDHVDGLTADDVVAHVNAAQAADAALVSEAQASIDSRKTPAADSTDITG